MKAASDNVDLIVGWSGEFENCHQESGGRTSSLLIKCTNLQGDAREWNLALSSPDAKDTSRSTERTKITASVTEIHGRYLPRDLFWRIWPRSGPRAADVQASLRRLKWIAEAPDRLAKPTDGKDSETDSLLTLLNVYTTQFGSYTTLLWQVPTLGLTAQAFLLLIALGTNNSDAARYTSSGLSIIIALAATLLMHDQRGRAINQAELAKRLSYKLSLKGFLGDLLLDDATPKLADPLRVWEADHSMYAVWRLCMILFIFVDAAVIVSTALGHTWFT